jgi:hypothetical protein
VQRQSERRAAKVRRRKARLAALTPEQRQDKLLYYGRVLARGRDNFATMIQRAGEVTYRDYIEGE